MVINNAMMMIYCWEFAAEAHTYNVNGLAWVIKPLHEGSEHPRLGPHGPTKETNCPRCPEPSLRVRPSLPIVIFARCPPRADSSQFHIGPFLAPTAPSVCRRRRRCGPGGERRGRESGPGVGAGGWRAPGLRPGALRAPERAGWPSQPSSL